MFLLSLVMVALASIPLSLAIGFSGKGLRKRSISPMYRASR